MEKQKIIVLVKEPKRKEGEGKIIDIHQRNQEDRKLQSQENSKIRKPGQRFDKKYHSISYDGEYLFSKKDDDYVENEIMSILKHQQNKEVVEIHEKDENKIDYYGAEEITRPKPPKPQLQPFMKHTDKHRIDVKKSTPKKRNSSISDYQPRHKRPLSASEHYFHSYQDDDHE